MHLYTSNNRFINMKAHLHVLNFGIMYKATKKNYSVFSVICVHCCLNGMTVYKVQKNTCCNLLIVQDQNEVCSLNTGLVISVYIYHYMIKD